MARHLTTLREVAHLYRGFLFDLACLRTDGTLPRAEPIRCVRELLARGKHVAVVQGTPLRASAVSALAERSGAPRGLASWSSGEFVRNCLQSRGAEQASPGPLAELLSAEERGKPLCVFEFGPLVGRPRRWTELAARGDPPLGGLGGILRRVDGVEDAHFCYWDAPPGDIPGAFVDAALELCAERRVPLLHAARSAGAMRSVAASAPKGSAEAAAAQLERLGGRSLAVGKLEGCLAGLGWHGELDPRELLLVSPDLGDVCEAAEHGLDALLVLGSHAQGQLAGFRSAEAVARASARRLASVSQRVAEDSPDMLAAASNPFLSVFKLPSLLAEASRKNAAHRERMAELQAKAAAAAPAPADAGGSGDIQGQAHAEVTEDFEPLLRRWCDANGVGLPAATMLLDLRWDTADAPAASTSGRRKRSAPRTAMLQAGGSEDMSQDVPAAPGRQEESLDDLLAKLGKQR